MRRALPSQAKSVAPSSAAAGTNVQYTITVSNLGAFGIDSFSAIINPPQSAILGVHATKERPVAENGQVVIRPIMYLALSYDHRIIDGKEAVTFLVKVRQYIEDPQRLLFGV